MLNLICVYDPRCNRLLNISLPILPIMVSNGLSVHVGKRHPGCVKYINDLKMILTSPDYIGHNAKEPDSVEYIKIMDKNVLVAVKLDTRKRYLYVASIYDISSAKLQKRLASGRFVKFR